jgi:NitT/TauT family transport system permease protein/sulfonate transport system permease protein
MRGSDLSRTLGQRALAESLVLAALVAWWWSSLQLPASVMPSPQAVFSRLLNIMIEPSLNWHVMITALRVIASVLLSLVFGLALALLAHSRPWLEGIIIDRILVVLNGMPSVGWAILAVIWFKVSDFTVIFVQVMILLPFALINFVEGLRNLDQEVIEMADSFSTRRSTTLIHVLIPMLLPYGIAALRVSYGVCWKIALVSELFGAQSGLGYVMLQAQSVGDVVTVVAICLIIVVLFMLGEALIINRIARALRRDIVQAEAAPT